MVSPPSIARTSALTCTAEDGASRRSASDQTLVSTNRLNRVFAPPCSQRTGPIRACRRDRADASGRLRAMNSCNAFVTAAFLVRSPLTSRARSIRSGSIERLVAMCEPPHKDSHNQAELAIASMIRGHAAIPRENVGTQFHSLRHCHQPCHSTRVFAGRWQERTFCPPPLGMSRRTAFDALSLQQRDLAAQPPGLSRMG